MSEAAKLGREFLNKVLERMPEDKRTSFATLMEDPAAADLLTEIGEGTLRQDDYSRKMTAIEEKAKAQAEWWGTAEPLAKLGESAQKAGWKPGTPATGTLAAADLPTDVVRSADLDARDMAAVAYFNHTTRLMLRHQRDFNEELDLNALTQAAVKNKRDVQQEYDAQFGPRYAEKAKVQRQAEIDTAVKEGVAAELKKLNIHPGAYPVGPSLGSPLDALEPQKGKLDADELTDAYHLAVAGKL